MSGDEKVVDARAGAELLVGLPDVKHCVFGGENINYVSLPGYTIQVTPENALIVVQELARQQQGIIRELLELRKKVRGS
ncbi:MAG: hypothetical protein K0U78_16390 [Actinomycetia bacterium]|nr:hypothetical protein [Actinomycetes bacterium]